MSINKEELMQALCDDLTDAELDMLIEGVRTRLQKGQSVDTIASQLMIATAYTIALAEPGASDEEVLEVAEEITNAIVDRVIAHAGGEVVDSIREVIPHDQLN